MSKSESGNRINKHFHCVANEFDDKEPCNSSDALSIWQKEDEDGNTYYDGFCFSCGQSFSKHQIHNSTHAAELGVEGGEVKERKEFVFAPKAEALSREAVLEFIRNTGYESLDYRGIRNDTRQFFGHVTKLNDSKTKVVATYYPETEAYKVTGYKCRVHPKDFSRGKLGRTGKESDLSGQVKWKNGGGKYLLITAGEEDKLAAYQMLRDDQIARNQGEYEPIHVVSATCGEGSLAYQVAKHYDWINTHDIIVVCLDQDKAGEKALADTCEKLPAEKVKILRLSGGDPNKMLQDGKHKQFVREFYGAKDFVQDGILSSLDADADIERELSMPKVPLPDFMFELQKAMAGGIPLGYWVNWIAISGAGKTTTVNEAIRKWIYDSPYKVGILSLELTAAQYMISMLSREVGYKINLIEEPQAAVEFVRRPEVIEARVRLKERDNGEERFALLDDREGSLTHVKKQIERLIKKHGCKLIIIDPINDLFDGSSMDEQAAFVKWMKATVKTGIIFSCVCHVRKGGVSTDKAGKRIVRELTEDDVSGLSLITKSAGANIFLTRDKYAEDPIVKNTTSVTMGKCRWTGITGLVGKWFYAIETHTMHDFNTYHGAKAAAALEQDIPVYEYTSTGISAPSGEDCGLVAPLFEIEGGDEMF